MSEPGMSQSEPSNSGENTQQTEEERLAALKAKVQEMEQETAKLRELQQQISEEGTDPNVSMEDADSHLDFAEREAIDSRSIYVGSVDYAATPEELHSHFQDVGSINRITILTDKYTGNPKGFAYIEFSEPALVADRTTQIRASRERVRRPVGRDHVGGARDARIRQIRNVGERRSENGPEVVDFVRLDVPGEWTRREREQHRSSGTSVDVEEQDWLRPRFRRVVQDGVLLEVLELGDRVGLDALGDLVVELRDAEKPVGVGWPEHVIKLKEHLAELRIFAEKRLDLAVVVPRVDGDLLGAVVELDLEHHLLQQNLRSDQVATAHDLVQLLKLVVVHGAVAVGHHRVATLVFVAGNETRTQHVPRRPDPHLVVSEQLRSKLDLALCQSVFFVLEVSKRGVFDAYIVGLRHLSTHVLQIVGHLVDNRPEFVVVVDKSDILIMDIEPAVVEIDLDIALLQRLLQERIVQTIMEPGCSQIHLKPRLGGDSVETSSKSVAGLEHQRVDPVLAEFDTRFEARDAGAYHDGRVFVVCHGEITQIFQRKLVF
ncbi:hypothetical protein OGATHE_000467 [Ogataea polymorpha]|uniref:RRM domain-containing protein n=1 Tax=Ogataea polymorpha TaxID=460523 RepID=A0A9P8PT20_9ASCO|nr:hypothetical protein OGATHE_000467 [Ogataea polymorpha]